MKTKIDKPTDNFCLILSPTIVTDKSPTYKNVSLACCQTACTKVQFGCLTLIWYRLYMCAFYIDYVHFIDYINFKEGDIAQPWSVISSCANGNSGIVPFSSFSTEWLSLIDIKKVIIWFRGAAKKKLLLLYELSVSWMTQLKRNSSTTISKI